MLGISAQSGFSLLIALWYAMLYHSRFIRFCIHCYCCLMHNKLMPYAYWNLSCIFTETAWMCAWFCDGASIWLDVKMIDEKRMWNALWNCVFSILLNNFEVLRTIISFPMMLRCSTTKLKSVISCHCNASNTFLNVAGSLKSLLQNYSTALTLSCLRLLSNFWRIHEIL